MQTKNHTVSTVQCKPQWKMGKRNQAQIGKNCTVVLRCSRNVKTVQQYGAIGNRNRSFKFWENIRRSQWIQLAVCYITACYFEKITAKNTRKNALIETPITKKTTNHKYNMVTPAALKCEVSVNKKFSGIRYVGRDSNPNQLLQAAVNFNRRTKAATQQPDNFVDQISPVQTSATLNLTAPFRSCTINLSTDSLTTEKIVPVAPWSRELWYIHEWRTTWISKKGRIR